MLATSIHMMRGTPYIYQGEELGMANPAYKEISDYRDVESINYYGIMQKAGKTQEEALETLRQRSRDNGRTPMQWDAGEYAGFSASRPWLAIPENHAYINAEAEEQDADSVLAYYRKLVALRKEYPVIQEGAIEFLYREVPGLLAYQRLLGEERLLALNNLTGEPVRLPKTIGCRGFQRLIGNYGEPGELIGELRAYESIVLWKP